MLGAPARMPEVIEKLVLCTIARMRVDITTTLRIATAVRKYQIETE